MAQFKNLTSILLRALTSLKSLLLITLAVFLAAFGLKAFLLPNSFIDGGVMGLAILASRGNAQILPFFIFLLNVPFFILGLNKINRFFAMKSALAVLFLSLVVAFGHFPVVTHDKLLAAVFGGILVGSGIGLAIRESSVLDGTEILALLLSRKVGVTVGDVILVINIIIFGLGAYVLGLELAMYSTLTYFAASRTADFLVHGLEAYTGITIVSNQTNAIKQLIFEETERGVTVFKGKGGFSNEEQEIIFCVVTRLEVPKIKNLVKSIDSQAFITMSPISEAQGGMVKNTT